MKILLLLFFVALVLVGAEQLRGGVSATGTTVLDDAKVPDVGSVTLVTDAATGTDTDTDTDAATDTDRDSDEKRRLYINGGLGSNGIYSGNGYPGASLGGSIGDFGLNGIYSGNGFNSGNLYYPGALGGDFARTGRNPQSGRFINDIFGRSGGSIGGFAPPPPGYPSPYGYGTSATIRRTTFTREEVVLNRGLPPNVRYLNNCYQMRSVYGPWGPGCMGQGSLAGIFNIPQNVYFTAGRWMRSTSAGYVAIAPAGLYAPTVRASAFQQSSQSSVFAAGGAGIYGAGWY
jgi:hypothetical protein